MDNSFKLMRIIKIFLLLSFGLWADIKLDIPNDINVSQLEDIVKNGWNDTNKTLNDFIVSNAERVMPEILEKIKKPILKGIITKDDPYPIARILLNKDDYLFIISYIKYLDNNQKIDKAKNLYILLLNGMASIEDKSFLTIIFHIVNEKLVTSSLINSIKGEYYSSKIKSELDIQLNASLTLDYAKYYESIEYEKNSVLIMVKAGFFKTPEKDSLEYIRFMTEVYDKFELNLNLYFNKMIIAIKTAVNDKNEKSINDFNLYMEQVKDTHLSYTNSMVAVLSNIKIKFNNFLGLKNENYGYMSEFIGITTALVAIPKVGSTTVDLISLVEQNKELLKELKR